MQVFLHFIGGGGEIRTHEGLTPSPVFKTGAFNRSATPPTEAALCHLIFVGTNRNCMLSVFFYVDWNY
jgi:hypothetical protein